MPEVRDQQTVNASIILQLTYDEGPSKAHPTYVETLVEIMGTSFDRFEDLRVPRREARG